MNRGIVPTVYEEKIECQVNTPFGIQHIVGYADQPVKNIRSQLNSHGYEYKIEGMSNNWLTDENKSFNQQNMGTIKGSQCVQKHILLMKVSDINIQVNLYDDRKINVQIFPVAKVFHLIMCIQQVAEIKENRLIIKYKDRQLGEDEKLNEVGLVNGSIIDVLDLFRDKQFIQKAVNNQINQTMQQQIDQQKRTILQQGQQMQQLIQILQNIGNDAVKQQLNDINQ